MGRAAAAAKALKEACIFLCYETKLPMKKIVFIFLLNYMSILAFAVPGFENHSRQAQSILNAPNPVDAIGNVSHTMDVASLSSFVWASLFMRKEYGDNAPAIYLNTIDTLLLHFLTRMEIERRTSSRDVFNRYLINRRQDAMVHMIDNSDLANAHRTIYGWIEEFRRRL